MAWRYRCVCSAPKDGVVLLMRLLGAGEFGQGIEVGERGGIVEDDLSAAQFARP